ncbi:hypothetical protein [Sulfoacidibacillus thermotolerans]|uniref:Uncharacterized protein n=1 Tax=Sulfoacidibacillus thermotolerans TaxID=1765684 RepID=A0A2U3CQD9_SULT2|nr:hypothetical protein [Sulfoacidibacillus thermotolerans]PWI51259.1 hypothetical protein BM613_14295 [Sulfoacidibacillus thermotolerans]
MTILGGSDSNSTQFAPGGNSPNFYIGQLGYANYAYFNEVVDCGSADAPSPNGWNPDLAARADYTYGFWMLHGPNGTPNGKTDYEWGQEQGYAAATSWNNQGCCGRVTVFADIEPDGTTNQWLTSGSLSDQGRNLEVLKGFVDALVNPPSDSPIPSLLGGAYCSPYTWNLLMGGATCSEAGISSAWTWRNRNYSTFPTTWNVNGDGENPQSFGGLSPVFWQYDVTDTEDYDACQGIDYLPL